jgi:hypothetical protein
MLIAAPYDMPSRANRPRPSPLGVGVTNRALRFSNRLYTAAWKATLVAIKEPAGTSASLAQIGQQIGRIGELPAPEPGWSGLRDAIVPQAQARLDWYQAGSPAGLERDLDAGRTAVSDRWRALAERFAADQRALAMPARRRRAILVWLVTASGTGLLLAVVQVRTDTSSPADSPISKRGSFLG